MRDADCCIHVDGNDISIFLFHSFSEISGHVVGFSDVVHYAVSKTEA